MGTPSWHRGGVSLFYFPSPCFALEFVQQFKPNIIGLHLTTGDQRWYIVGCYLAPNNTLTIESDVAALKNNPGAPNCLLWDTLT